MYFCLKKKIKNLSRSQAPKSSLLATSPTWMSLWGWGGGACRVLQSSKIFITSLTFSKAEMWTGKVGDNRLVFGDSEEIG